MSGLKTWATRIAALVAIVMAIAPGAAEAAPPAPAFKDAPAPVHTAAGRQMRCMALVAYAEAAIDGERGMQAVVRVIRNRMQSGAFPADACAVVLQDRQFQPVGENDALRKVLADPESFAYSDAFGSIDEARMAKAAELAAASLGKLARKDPTVGALFFVNPLFMDADKCPWFAALKKTAVIGGHVFMTNYRPGEKAAGPAIDCATAGTGTATAGRDVDPPLPRDVGVVLRQGQGRFARGSDYGDGGDRRRVTVVLGGRIDRRVRSGTTILAGQ